MKKKILLAAALLLVSINPFLSGVRATENGWTPVVAEAAWNHDAYRVERLAFAPRTLGPLVFGQTVLVAEPPAVCYGETCNNVTVSLLKNGRRFQVSDVPLTALDADRFAKNGNRMIYARPTADGIFAVYELNLATGAETTLFSNVSIPGGSNLDVLVDNRGTYFVTADVRFSNANTAFTQRALYLWDASLRAVRPVVGHANFTDRRMELLDVQNGVAFVKMGFPDGSTQLWTFDSNNVDFNGGQATEIPSTWTDATGAVQYGRFLPDGSVEYFEHFVRYTWQAGSMPVRGGELLSWYRTIPTAVKLDGETLAWLTAEDTLYVSVGGTVRKVGTATGGTFVLENGTLFFDGKALNLATNEVMNALFRVSDVGASSFAGVDADGNVLVGIGSAAPVRVGFGTAAAVVDAQHVYWRGVDGAVYAATFKESPATASVRALRIAAAPTIYLVTEDGVRHAIPNEKIYFSWFKDWKAVQTVTIDELNHFPTGTPATFAVGSLLKLAGDPKIYAVAHDGSIRHVRNAQTGYALFGEDWYSKIITVSEVDLVAFKIGADLTSAADGENAF